MKIRTITATTGEALRNAGAYVGGLTTPSVRLGVTGLSRAGKTVFITALVRNLVAGGRLPFFRASAERRLRRAYLEPQPDDAVARFPYEDHLACLAGTPPNWPEGTRRISQLRVTIEYDGTGWMSAIAGRVGGEGSRMRRLHVDIVDYPGEWLVDLMLLRQDFAAWSAAALSAAQAPRRAAAAAPFLRFLDEVGPRPAEPEQAAINGAKLFTAYLAAARAAEPALAVLTPGRFLMPGELEGSPVLTFFPWVDAGGAAPGPLAALLARRFESYKSQVVRPFFRDHFSRLDRQIVLMDVLSALDRGPEGLADLQSAMGLVLDAFRPGINSWTSAIFRPRIDRIVFAATKADHLHRQSHDRLEALMRTLADGAMARAAGAGADVQALALAAIRSTREAEARDRGEVLPCIVGTPLAGERVGDTVFDGVREAALFPGDLPRDPSQLLSTPVGGSRAEADIRTLTFRPPRLVLETAGGVPGVPPHIRLDRAIEFLIGDHLT